MSANYNNSARYYDRLSRMVYGKALMEAQIYLLYFIPAQGNMLIVGGGTGWILDELTKIHPLGINITYVEVSKKMIEISKKRDTGLHEITFINDAIENVSLAADFDYVITPFLFDNFTEETMQKVFWHINALLKPHGTWLNCDFQLTGKWWQRMLLRSMFLFFKITCNIEASKLPPIDNEFEKQRFYIHQRQTFFKGFIVSTVYDRIP